MEWRQVISYEGLYEVSDEGQIRAIEKIRIMPSRWGHKNNSTRIYPAKIMKQVINCDGHHRIKLFKEGKSKMWLVHRLVGFAFVFGYFEGAIINHLDGNKSNNTPPNLEWTNVKGNINHAFENGLMRDKHGKVAKKKFTISDILKIRKLHSKGEITAKQVSEEYGCHYNYVYLIFKNKRWII